MSSRLLKFKILSLLVVFLSLAPAVYARQVSITILHTTDLHGHVFPTRDYQGTEGVGGVLRLATAIEAQRKIHTNVLLVDCGDLYQGGMESYLSQGQIMNEALGWLQYDAWVLGNHEFDWGLNILSPAVENSPAEVLAANMKVRPGLPHPLARVRPFVIRDIDGVRVALVGLTTEAIPNWSRPHLLGDLLFTDSVEALREIMPTVRAQRPDILILLAHQGYRPFGDNAANQINRIARHFPEFDLILGGHSHQPVPSANVNGILYSQAGYFGIWLGKATLVYDTVARRVVERTAELIHIDGDVPIHEELQQELQEYLDRAEQAAGMQVGNIAEPMPARDTIPGQSAIQQLIARSIAEASKADVVLHGILANESLSAGPVYERDVWRIIPYENTIGIVHLSPSELLEILEENATLFRSIQFMGVYGIQYELHAYADPGQRVRNVRWADGRHIHPRTRLRVAMNSYVLASGGLRFPTVRRLADSPRARLEMTGIDTRSAVRNYIRRQGTVAFPACDAVQLIRTPVNE